MNNRTIKFRAWSKREQSMIEGYPVIEKGVFTTFMEDITGSSWGVKAWGLVLMQFTGLLDKNGKEIYEGDIVKDRNGVYLEVIYEDASFVLEDKVVDDTYHFYSLDFMLGQLEIIGNVYENPELLEGSRL